MFFFEVYLVHRLLIPISSLACLVRLVVSIKVSLQEVGDICGDVVGNSDFRVVVGRGSNPLDSRLIDNRVGDTVVLLVAFENECVAFGCIVAIAVIVSVVRLFHDSINVEEVGDVKYLRSTCVWQQKENSISIFAINRSGEEMDFSAILKGFAPKECIYAKEIRNDSPDAVNTADIESVKPEDISSGRIKLENETLTAKLAPYSWNILRVSL